MNQRIQTIENSTLNNELQTAKGKTAGAEANAAIKKWCNSTFTKPFKGEKEQTFKNASKICVTGV